MQMEWSPQSMRICLVRALLTLRGAGHLGALRAQLVPLHEPAAATNEPRSFACSRMLNRRTALPTSWQQAVPSLPGQIHPEIYYILSCLDCVEALPHKRKWDPIYPPKLLRKRNNEAFELQALSKENQETGVRHSRRQSTCCGLPVGGLKKKQKKKRTVPKSAQCVL